VSLLAPLFLIGLSAIALPIWLHRRRQPTAEKQIVASLMLFERHPHRNPKRMRIVRWLLLALRIALVALVVAAFSQPIWQGLPDARAAASRLDLIVVDTSLSMGLGDRFERARAAASQAVQASLSAGADVVLIAASHRARTLAGPTSEAEILTSAIAELAPGPSRLSYGALARELPAAIEAARTALQRDGSSDTATDVRVTLVSDLQRSAAPSRAAALLAAPIPNLQVQSVAEETSPASWSIESATATATSPDERRVSGVIRGFSTPEATRTLRLRVDGELVGEQSLRVPPSGRATFVFDGVRPAQGSIRILLEIAEDDALDTDDAYRMALELRPPQRILLAAPDSAGRAALYYSAAIRAAAPGELVVDATAIARLDDADLASYPLVVVTGAELLSESAERRLADHVRGGGALLLALGAPPRARAGRVPVTGHELLPQSLAVNTSADGRALIDVAAPAHPALAATPSWDGVNVFRHVRIAPRQGDDVLLRVADGDPMLIEHRIGTGRALVLATALDASTSDLPLRPLFVPFARASARYLIDLREPPSTVTVDTPLPIGPLPTQIYDESGIRLLSLAESGGGAARDAISLDALGFYRVTRGGTTRYVAVNPDPRESDPTAMNAELVTQWEQAATATATGPTAAARTDVPMTPLWPYLLLAALCAALAEAAVANWGLGRSGSAEPVEHGGRAPGRENQDGAASGPI
jgi:hypothetical protein